MIPQMAQSLILKNSEFSSDLVTALGADRWFLFTHLLLIADPQGFITDTQQQLARRLQMSRYTMSHHMKALVGFQWQGHSLLETARDSAGRIRIVRINARWQSVVEPPHGVEELPHDAPELVQPEPVEELPQRVEELPQPDSTLSLSLSLKAKDPIPSNSHTLQVIQENLFSLGQVLKQTIPDPGSFDHEGARDDTPPAEPCQALAEKPSSAPHTPGRTALLRHQQLAEDRTLVPFLVAWGRDGKIYKTLTDTYPRELLAVMQDAYFAQPLDSFASRKGFSVPQFLADAPGLATLAQAQSQLTPDQRAVFATLQARGVLAETALDLVSTQPLADIQAQVEAHPRRDRTTPFMASAASLVKAIREQWPLPAPEPSLPDLSDWDSAPPEDEKAIAAKTRQSIRTAYHAPYTLRPDLKEPMLALCDYWEAHEEDPDFNFDDMYLAVGLPVPEPFDYTAPLISIKSWDDLEPERYHLKRPAVSFQGVPS